MTEVNRNRRKTLTMKRMTTMMTRTMKTRISSRKRKESSMISLTNRVS